MNGKSLAIYDYYIALCLHILEQNYCFKVVNLVKHEWNFQQSLDWHLLEYSHKGAQTLVKELNNFIKKNLLYMKNNFRMKVLNG